MNGLRTTVDDWLSAFALDGFVHDHVAEVFTRLPPCVRDELMNDRGFTMFDYEPGPGVVRHIPVGVPQSGKPARAVELKRTLRSRPVAFVR